nr:hypothetical protein [Methanobrevibacter arboriphilus]
MDDTYDFFNKEYLYHLPSLNYKLKGYLSDLKKKNLENESEMDILKKIYKELDRIRKKEEL